MRVLWATRASIAAAAIAATTFATASSITATLTPVSYTHLTLPTKA